MTIKTFGNENEDNVEIKEYSFCVRGMSGVKTFMLQVFELH